MGAPLASPTSVPAARMLNWKNDSPEGTSYASQMLSFSSGRYTCMQRCVCGVKKEESACSVVQCCVVKCMYVSVCGVVWCGVCVCDGGWHAH